MCYTIINGGKMNSDKRKNEILSKLNTIKSGVKHDMVSDVYVKWINQTINYIQEITSNA